MEPFLGHRRTISKQMRIRRQIRIRRPNPRNRLGGSHNFPGRSRNSPGGSHNFHGRFRNSPGSCPNIPPAHRMVIEGSRGASGWPRKTCTGAGGALVYSRERLTRGGANSVCAVLSVTSDSALIRGNWASYSGLGFCCGLALWCGGSGGTRCGLG